MIKILEMSINQVLWYKDDTDVYFFNDIHIHYIINNSILFNMTNKEIENIYNNYNEPIGTEGKARNRILQIVMNNGWIRGRCRNNKWFIEVDNFKLRKNNIKRCIEFLLLENKSMQVYHYISVWDKEKNIYKGKIYNLFKLLEIKR